MTTTYKLTGNGVGVTFVAEPPGLEMELDDSFAPFTGSQNATADVLSVSEPGAAGFEVSANLSKEVAGRAGPRTDHLGVRVFLGIPVSPDVESPTVGQAVFITGGTTLEFRTEALAGTVAVQSTGRGSRGGRGGR